jgi:hypothetical protein
VLVGFGVHGDGQLRKKGDRLGNAGRIEPLSSFRHAKRVCNLKTPVSRNPNALGFGKFCLDRNGSCTRLIREQPA